MNIIELIRLEESEQGTFGVLKINKELFCLTLEPKDMENQQDVSSIPVQQYICELYESSLFGKTFKVMRVPGRTDVLFHSGNIEDDTMGCIIVGDRLGKYKNKKAVMNSKKTHKKFMSKINGLKFHLTIKEEY